ncbi:MAG: hypothetical protein OWR52_03075 [Acidibacillus sp.]|uniref:Uncharacterized protein n=1 Tax=Sulfoacidibacillus ferrooxidans TaxID=2005001 RepID=A0A9X1V6J5_9BACL|nr:hypothetical protein [Sulfoacidibacillus ferrooxidans]MCI0182102.1 hypothetical protein [Sulfoacidibacillus ferrooxidans]MCY0892475.1 hypothetical protein [Acidibacillus sp.]
MTDETVSDTNLPKTSPEKNYARTTGWIYLVVAITSLFTDNLWHMLHFSTSATIASFAIGLTGLTISRSSNNTYHRYYNLFAGATLTVWGLTGTLYPQWFKTTPLPLDNGLHVITGIWGFYGVGSLFWSRISRKSS